MLLLSRAKKSGINLNKLEETNHIKVVYEVIEQYRVLKPNVKYIVNIDKDIKMKIDSNDFK
ncbi:hypothetical protein [Clostridium sp. HCS.1]|uniref:hypothetical protein n=1 Tax=Clostridium sp. HCS.1 TaxID=3238594 RepID=UPI003A1001A1